MIIRVDTLENLVKDVATCLGTPVQTMLDDIQSIDFRMGDKSGYAYIEEHQQNKLTEVFLCHLARRLNDDDNNTILLPLNQLLTTSNAFSDFLAIHKIKFSKDKLELIYKGNLIDWAKSKSKCFNSARFRSRLEKDFCVNGFQFLYDIKNSAGSDYLWYTQAPELLQDLDYLLDLRLVSEFRDISESYCALCPIPIKNLVFDCNYTDRNFEERYIYSSLSYISEYVFAKRPSGNNPRLRALDFYLPDIEQWIPEESIKCHN